MTRLSRIAPCALALLALGALPATSRAQRETRSRIDTTVAFNKGGSVNLGIVSGNITVTGWTRPEAKIVASVERGDLDVELGSNRISVQVRSRWRDLGEAHYELMVPVGTRVSASAVSGDVQVKGTASEVSATSVSGDVEVVDAGDRVTLHSVSGDVHGTKLHGYVRAESVSGDLTLDDIAGDIGAHTVSGTIDLQHAQASQLRAETVSGEITYVGSIDTKGTYDISTHSGDVRLDIPAGSSADLEMQTFSGDINSAFPMTLQPGEQSRGRRNRRMHFTIGSGGAHVTIETFSGDITIERSGRSAEEN